MDRLILVSLLVILLSYTIYSEIARRRLLRDIYDLVDGAIRGDGFLESYDESYLSKLEIKLYRFLKDNVSLREDLERDRDSIKSLIGDISHQTKTPIANISLYVDLLLEKYEDKHIEIISSETAKLGFLLEALLKSSRLETGLIQLNREEFKLEDLIEDLILDFSHGDIGFETGLEKDLKVNLDYRWTKEALGNIIENAIKYSANRPILIGLSSTSIYCKISVESYGEPIPKEDYNKIFQRFYRGENGRLLEGVGIGLFLSKEIIEMEAGYIMVDYVEGRNIFSVFLPLD